MSIGFTLITLAQEHAEEVAGGGDSSTRVVLPEPNELIWGAIAFLILFVALAKFAWPRLRQTLQDREDAIRSELERAEQARVEAEQRREEYDARIADAKNEADRIMREANEASEQVRQDRIARAEDEARQIVEKARSDAAQESQRAFADLQRTVADLSLEAAKRVIEAELSNPDAQRKLVEQFIASTGAGANN